MLRLLSRWGAAFLRAMSTHGMTLAAVPDPHGQFPAVPIPWCVAENGPEDVVVPEQSKGPPSWHPDHTR